MDRVDNDVNFALTQENQNPVAIASADITAGKKPLKVTFTGSGTDSDGAIASYSWDFGDGVTANLQNPIHIYQREGDFTARLIVTDSNGDVGKDTITINVVKNEPPHAYANAIPSSGAIPLTVYFQGSGEDDDGNIVSYQWSGCIWSNSQNALRTFYFPGTYYARFTVTDNDGEVDTTTVCVTVCNLRTMIKKMVFGS